jgi:hypothetical protein
MAPGPETAAFGALLPRSGKKATNGVRSVHGRAPREVFGWETESFAEEIPGVGMRRADLVDPQGANLSLTQPPGLRAG